MPFFDPHTNLAISTIATAPSPASSGTSLTVATGQGGRFSATGTGQTFRCLVWPAGSNPDPSNAEIIQVTTRAGDVFSPIVRAQEGSSARAIVVGDQIMQVISAKSFTDIEDAVKRIWLPATEWKSGLGAPTYNAGFGGGWPILYDSWTLHNATADGLYMPKLVHVPGNWNDIAISLVFLQTTTGNVHIDMVIGRVPWDASAFITVAGASLVGAFPLTGGGVLKVPIGTTSTHNWNDVSARIVLDRNGPAADDTYPADIEFLGMLLEAAR